jgi:hypothetical protein
MKQGGPVFEAATIAELRKQMAEHFEDDGSVPQIEALTMHNDEDLEMEFTMTTIGWFMVEIDNAIKDNRESLPELTDYEEHNTHWGL